MSQQSSCCVPGCPVTIKDGIPLHRFPNPDAKAEKFNTWISKIGGEIATLDNSYVYMNKKVCDKHFEEIHKYPSKRLSKLATPVLCLPEQPHIDDTESVTPPALPATSDDQRTQCSICMTDQLCTEPVTTPAPCSTSGVQETSSHDQMKCCHNHKKPMTFSSKFEHFVQERDQSCTEPVTTPATCSTSGVQETSSHDQTKCCHNHKEPMTFSSKFEHFVQERG